MCRWISYSGDPISLESILITPQNSLIDQSMSAKMSAKPTNADGFGVGWYGRNNEPGIYRSTLPAWGDQNLKEISHHISSGLFMAHVRRSTGTPVQTSNCHPFRHANWMFVHNGLIRDFQKIRRELVVTVDPKYFSYMEGNTDSELIFFLALTFGLREDPLRAVELTIGLIEKLAKEQGTAFPIQMSLGITDGQKLYAFRYSSEGDSRSLFYSNSADEIKALYPDNLRARDLTSNMRAVVSEPLSDLQGVWLPVDESTMLIVEQGDVSMQPFKPHAP
ncbi:glutamine amidotransferase [Alteromonadaceae bacterium Bs31]|nr:glutamine amidotransferase [Alteromonadaceae bacterium Bs31]